MSTEEVEAIMKEAELNRDGRLDYAEVQSACSILQYRLLSIIIRNYRFLVLRSCFSSWCIL